MRVNVGQTAQFICSLSYFTTWLRLKQNMSLSAFFKEEQLLMYG